LKRFVGSICALATPFRGDGLDLAAFGALIDYQLAGGTQGLVVAGSTGEAHALGEAEFERALAFALERVAGRVPVLAGTGTANTRKTISATRRAQSTGADAALVVTPYYVRPTQEGLYRHFTAIADEAGLPIVLYNVPSRTGCDMLPETVARLAGHERIIGIKEARNDAARIAAVIALDGTCAQAMLDGADGVISVAANVAPAAMRALCDAALANDATRTRELDGKLTELYALLGTEPNPIPVKWCLHALGICLPDLRLPLTPFGSTQHEAARQVLGALSLATVQPRHSGVA
jgi:4-hydroxy-tetrahydrodipicolinate synthase